MHPQMVMQVEMEHQNVGMDRNAREQPRRDLLLQLQDFVLGVVVVALRGLAHEMAEHVAGRFERQAARATERLRH